MAHSRRTPRLLSALLTLLLIAASASSQPPGVDAALERARRAIEAEDPEAALEILRPLGRRKNVSAETLVLLSTAQFMAGDTSGGRETLARALEIDPDHRPSWLNLAAVEMAEGSYEEALAALQQAERIDPEATENDINIGAVLVLLGDVGQASRRFNRYLSEHRSSAESYYLVATNYALASQWSLALQHLEAAIRLDERIRRRARVDPNFGPIGDSETFRVLLETDSYRPPPAAFRHVERFDAPYDGSHGHLLKAVLNALQFSGRPFDPNVEVTDQWALVWGDMRLKISNAPEGGGQIEITVTGDRMSAAEWDAQRESLLGEIREQLALLTMRRP